MAASSKRLNGCSGLPLSLFGTVNENREGQNYSGARCALEKTQPEVTDFLVFLKENYVFMLGGFCVFVAPHLLNVFFCPRVKEQEPSVGRLISDAICPRPLLLMSETYIILYFIDNFVPFSS